MSNEISIELYKGSNLEKAFGSENLQKKKEDLIKGIEDTLKSNLEKGVIDQELFDKAKEELDILKGGPGSGRKGHATTKKEEPKEEGEGSYSKEDLEGLHKELKFHEDKLATIKDSGKEEDIKKLEDKIEQVKSDIKEVKSKVK